MVHIEHVQRQYSESELLTFGKEQAHAVGEMDSLEDQKKSATEHFKSAISKQQELVKDLAKRINMGYEIIPTPCDIVLNRPTKGLKSIISQKTLEVIKVVPMTEDDRQLGLYDGSEDL